MIYNIDQIVYSCPRVPRKLGFQRKIIINCIWQTVREGIGIKTELKCELCDLDFTAGLIDSQLRDNQTAKYVTFLIKL